MSERITRRGVVVGVDGSPSSRVAARWAAREAAMRNLPLSVVHIAHPPAIESQALQWPGARTPADLMQLREDEARAIVTDAITALEESDETGDRPEIDCDVLYGRPVSSLVELSEDAQMVVVGCRGRSAVGRGILGSVSIGLIHRAHCPVAVIHDGVSSSRDAPDLPVLVGIDGSGSSEAATGIAFDEASWRGVDLVAMHVWSDADVSMAYGMEWSALQPAAEATLAESLAGWQERYPDVKVHRLVECEYPARQILEQSEDCQLVVVGRHGRGGSAGTLLGSVSTAVVQAARVPVIVARQE